MLVLKPWRIQILLAVVIVLFIFAFVVGMGGDQCDKTSIRVLDNGKHEFSFLMKIVYDGLLENGFKDVKLVDHVDTSLNCLYITADTHDLKFLPTRYIAYNWEQLTVTNPLNGILLSIFIIFVYLPILVVILVLFIPFFLFLSFIELTSKG
jgi:hypothetical protein